LDVAIAVAVAVVCRAGAAVARDACQTMMCTLTRNPPCNAAPGYAFAPAIKAFNAANTDAARPALILDLITHVFEQTGAAFRNPNPITHLTIGVALN
jgi:hypothetical protein